MKTLKNGFLEKGLEGREVGYPDGQIICDGCGKRLNAFRHLRHEGEPLTITAFCATPRGRFRTWSISLVYCEECDEREIGTPTKGVDEAMIECKLTKGPHSPQVAEVEVVDRSKP